jgi:adenylyltransferase/sulfurtransferase
MHLNECAPVSPQLSPQDNSAPASTAANTIADNANTIADAAGAIADNDRYSRQVLFPGIGPLGQQRLAASHVAIVGCGAMGAASASLLARAGVGTLTLIDRDFVEPSNLQRQVLFDESDARDSLPKAEAARRHIALFNSRITVHARIRDLTPTNIAELIPSSVHIVLDATDNFETRFLINDFAVQRGLPWIYAAAIGAYAATMNILPAQEPVIPTGGGAFAAATGGPDERTCSLGWSVEGPPHLSCLPTACLACIFPNPPTGNVETCDTAGILSTAVNLAASIQVTEALKFLTGQPHLMRRTLLSFDLWNPVGLGSPADHGYLDHSEISTSTPRPDCEVCGQRIFTHLAGQDRAHITLCGRDSVQIHEHHRPVDFNALRDRLAGHADISDLRSNDLLLRFRRGSHTLTVFADGRAIVQGTTDIALARSLYARFIGA